MPKSAAEGAENCRTGEVGRYREKQGGRRSSPSGEAGRRRRDAGCGDVKHRNIVTLLGFCVEESEMILVIEKLANHHLGYHLGDAYYPRRRLATVARRSFLMGTLDEMIDPIIKEEASESKFILNRGPNKDSLKTFIEIANQCVAETQDQRPTMNVVVKELEKALFFQGHHLPDIIKNKFKEGKLDEVVFEQIKEPIKPKSLATFQNIAYQCLHHEREKRPTMKTVLMELKKAMEFQLTHSPASLKPSSFATLGPHAPFTLFAQPQLIRPPYSLGTRFIELASMWVGPEVFISRRFGPWPLFWTNNREQAQHQIQPAHNRPNVAADWPKQLVGGPIGFLLIS
ncbi:hypothetical protein E3N88_18226 [Mikania micrantha]|uniref:Protein kinase domain-containing protein n=1 Tax=Mikania micrantha TaxID=192012 RepID=A0A5N6NVI4_9ASTR|nr:hypothetical protein E3N88_18226 [Mikania micrantha]